MDGSVRADIWEPLQVEVDNRYLLVRLELCAVHHMYFRTERVHEIASILEFRRKNVITQKDRS